VAAKESFQHYLDGDTTELEKEVLVRPPGSFVAVWTFVLRKEHATPPCGCRRGMVRWR
jgi:hypothetical protein